MPVPFSGQITLTGAAQPLSTNQQQATWFVIKAPVTNGNAAYIGGPAVTTGTGYQLDPGEDIAYTTQTQNPLPRMELRPSDFSVVGVPGDRITFLASQ